MKLEINKDEQAILEELLHRASAALPFEIHHCKINEFKSYLKDKQKMIEDLAEKVKSA